MNNIDINLVYGIDRSENSWEQKVDKQDEVLNTSAGKASLERLLQNSQTYLKLENYAYAEEVYTTITKEYPEDYRGWWGLIVSRTRNFSELTLDRSNLNIWFGYVKKLAEPKSYDEMEKKYIEYTRNVSMLAATEDMKEVNALINGLNSEIMRIEQQVHNINEQKRNTIQDFPTRMQEIEERIYQSESMISDEEYDLKHRKIQMIIGGVLIGIGVISLFLGGWSGFCTLFIFGGIGLPLCVSAGYFATKKTTEGLISSAERVIESANALKESENKHYKSEIAYFNSQIAAHQSDIDQVRNRIAFCRKYLDLGEDKISTYWFALMCGEFGVQQLVDQQVMEYRNALFDSKKQLT